MHLNKTFNPRQYLAIDIANHYGLDKLTFEERIDWVKTNINRLEALEDNAEEPLLYAKAVTALRNSYNKPIGHIVALDATCSGLQIMSALMRCHKGGYLTNLIDPDSRKDAYTLITERMNTYLDKDITVSRKDAKEAVMTAFYGSKVVPETVFPNPKVLKAFYKTLETECKGAYELLNILLNSWNPKRDFHDWYLPDGHYVYCPVIESVNKRINLDSWDYMPNVIIREQKNKSFGLSNPANVIHSIDGYLLRTLVRRCNYNPTEIKRALLALKSVSNPTVNNSLGIVIRWNKTQMADITELNTITDKANELPKELIDKLIHILEMVLTHEPFDIVCIHDSFGCHANHCNQLRFHYKEILAELSESTVIEDICNQLYSSEDTIDKGESIADYIRNSNYAIC